MFKLNAEQLDILLDLMEHEGWQLLNKVVLPAIMEEQGKRVLTVSGESLEATQIVVAEQLRYQGMTVMSKKCATLKELLRPAKTRETGVKQK